MKSLSMQIIMIYEDKEDPWSNIDYYVMVQKWWARF